MSSTYKQMRKNKTRLIVQLIQTWLSSKVIFVSQRRYLLLIEINNQQLLT